MNVPPKCDLLLIGFWDTAAVDNRGPEWQTTPHASVSHTHTNAHMHSYNTQKYMDLYCSQKHKITYTQYKKLT